MVSIVIVLIAAVLGYYFVEHHEEENPQITPAENNSTHDSTINIYPEKTSATLGIKPEVDPKDGSVKIVEEFIKFNVKNPSTYDFFEWSDISAEGGYWKVKCKYKGVSSFNKEVTTTAWFYIQNNKVVHTKIISKI